MTLAHRLTRLLDVLQQVHGIKRSVACRVVGEHCGVSHRYVSNIATDCVRVLGQRESKLNHTALRGLEDRYALPLRYLAAYKSSCQRFHESPVTQSVTPHPDCGRSIDCAWGCPGCDQTRGVA